MQFMMMMKALVKLVNWRIGSTHADKPDSSKISISFKVFIQCLINPTLANI